MVVLQLLHQAYLCLLLNRLVGRSVLTDTEGVVGPDELDGHFHQGCHTYGGLHIVGEDEEGAAGGDDTTVEVHTDTHTGHGELSHTGLEESTLEVTALQTLGLLQETVGLVGVGEQTLLG